MTEPSKPKEGEKSVPCVEDQKVNILPKNYLHAPVRWESLRKILQVGLELNECLQTVNAGTNETQTFFDSNLVPL